MAVQSRQDISTVPLIRSGDTFVTLETLAYSSGDDLERGTVLAKKSADGKYVAFTDESATDGSALPAGIYLGPTIDDSDLDGTDIDNVEVLTGGACTIDASQVLLHNSKTLNTAIGGSAAFNATVRDILAWRGIFVEETVDIDEFENS